VGLVNDFHHIGEGKVETVAKFIPMYEWENNTHFSHITCVWDRYSTYVTTKGMDGLPDFERSVLHDIICEAGLYMVGVGRYKYIDYLRVEVDVAKDGITMVASASCGDGEEDEDWWCEDDVTFTLPYTFTCFD
tara:strand:- start:1604 stop:2002 length:399 start_codon:yes stop_codon:yes gene_type:complete